MIFVDPEYVDVLAATVIALDLECEQSKCDVAEGVRKHALSPDFQNAITRHADYCAKRQAHSDRVKEIAQRYGTYCHEADCLILVGTQYVIQSKNRDVTVIVCADSASSQ